MNPYQKEYDFVVKFNESDLPYHNSDHLTGVANIVRKYIEDNPDVESVQNGRNIVYAALLHDFCHLGDVQDSRNIEHTLIRIDDYRFFDEFDVDHNSRSIIRNIIKNTCFPHHPISTQHKSILIPSEIVRNADMIYSTIFCSKEIVEGLFTELGSRSDIHDLDIWVSRNMQFLSSLEFKDPWFKNKNEIFLPIALQCHAEMLKVNQ